MLTDEDRKAAQEWADKDTKPVQCIQDLEPDWNDFNNIIENHRQWVIRMKVAGYLHGIEHERKRRLVQEIDWTRGQVICPVEPAMPIEPVGKKHWRIKDE